MSEPKKPIEKEKKYYSKAKDYQTLGDIEHIRQLPGNYVGSPDERGCHHLFQEVIDNSIDEVVANNCNYIKVTLSADQETITVEDNGNGIPIETMEEIPLTPDMNPRESVLAEVFSSLKTGGKFEGKIYKTAGGLHGIGITAVNALSKSLKV